jgi:hypothetical protein
MRCPHIDRIWFGGSTILLRQARLLNEVIRSDGEQPGRGDHAGRAAAPLEPGRQAAAGAGDARAGRHGGGGGAGARGIGEHAPCVVRSVAGERDYRLSRASAAGAFVPAAVVVNRPVSMAGSGGSFLPLPAATIEIELPNGCRLRVHEWVVTSTLYRVIAVLCGSLGGSLDDSEADSVFAPPTPLAAAAPASPASSAGPPTRRGSPQRGRAPAAPTAGSGWRTCWTKPWLNDTGPSCTELSWV